MTAHVLVKARLWKLANNGDFERPHSFRSSLHYVAKGKDRSVEEQILERAASLII